MERDVNIIIKNNYNSYFSSSQNNEIDIIDHFIEFFRIYFINNPFIPEKEKTARFYMSLMWEFINNNKEFDERFINAWQTEIQPCLLNKFPPVTKGLHNIHSDMEYLIQLMDELSNKYKKINEMKNAEKKANIKNNTTTEVNQITVDNENNKNLSKLPVSNQVKVDDKTPKFNIDIIEFSKDIDIPKRTKSMINLRLKSDTIASSTTGDSSTLIEDTNLNLNINELTSVENTPKSHITNFEEIFNNNDKESKMEKNKKLPRSRSMCLNNIMSAYYKIEDEKEGINIIHKEKDNSLKFISPDLMLKKIIFDNFLETDTIIVHDFCAQCFSFLNKEIYFKKIFNCYKVYKDSGTSFEKLKNLIDFIGILVIEMFDYYKKIEESDPTLVLIKNFYRELINDLLFITQNEKNIIEEKTGENQENYSDNNDYYSDFFIDKEELIKKNINIDLDFEQNVHKELFYYDPTKNKYFRKNKSLSRKISLQINGINESKVKNQAAEKAKLSPRLKDVTPIIEDEKEDTSMFDLDDFVQVNNENDKEKTKEKKEIKENQKNQENEEVKSDEDSEILQIDSDNEENKQADNIDETIIKILKKANIDKNFFISFAEKQLYNIQHILNLISSEEPDAEIIKAAKGSVNFYDLLSRAKKKLPKHQVTSPSKSRRFTRSTSYYGTTLNRNKANQKDFLKKGYFSVLDWKCEEIGEELLRISKTSLDKINRRELYKAIYMKKEKQTDSPNVMLNISKFNNLTSFVIEDILSYDLAKDRAKIIEKWAQICDYLKDRKDYNDCLAIFSALNNYIITGLKLTFKELKSKTNTLIKTLSKFCTCEGNYKNIREDMKNSLEKGEIVVPYLGMMLRDITFHEENGKYINDNGLINIEKIEKIQILLDENFKYQKVNNIPCLNVNNNIKELGFFNDLFENTEEELEKIAYGLEPEYRLNFCPSKSKRKTKIDKKYFEKFFQPNERNSYVPKYKSSTMVNK